MQLSKFYDSNISSIKHQLTIGTYMENLKKIEVTQEWAKEDRIEVKQMAKKNAETALANKEKLNKLWALKEQ